MINLNLLKNPSELYWLNPSYVGDPLYPAYNGRQVVVATPALNAFANYMNSKSLPFSYDHAVALFKYIFFY